MIWWYWFFLGLVLLAAELLTPSGFYMLFFGLSCLAVGSLAGLGLVTTEWVQWLLFSVLSIVTLLVFRDRLLAWTAGGPTVPDDIDSMIGEPAVLLDDLGPHATGKAELRGSTWTVRNADATPLTKGQRTRVQRVQGLTLWVGPE